MQQQSGVDGAATAGHHQPFQRGEAHGGVHASSRRDGAQRAAGAQVAADQPQGGRPGGQGHAGSDHLGHMLMAEAMEPEAPQALASPVGGNGIGGRFGRQGGVEGGIEAGPLLQVRPLARQPVHHPQGGAVVQGSQGHQVR